MWPAWIAAPAAFLLVGLALLCNSRWFGFLPDDPPGKGRKQHARPTPLCGVLLLPVLVAPFVADPAWPVAAALFVAALVGYRDDRGKERGGGMDWRAKAVGLLIAAAFATATAAARVAPPWLPLLVVLAFVLINATNFLDNMDGVATALAAASLLSLSRGQGPFAWAGFTALGFLPWNWPRPRAFLGDAGAFALGTCTAAALVDQLITPSGEISCPPLLSVAIQLADFTQVVTARIVLALPPWVGDRRHLTHILDTQLHVPRVLVAPLLAALAVLLAHLAAA